MNMILFCNDAVARGTHDDIWIWSNWVINASENGTCSPLLPSYMLSPVSFYSYSIYKTVTITGANNQPSRYSSPLYHNLVVRYPKLGHQCMRVSVWIYKYTNPSFYHVTFELKAEFNCVTRNHCPDNPWILITCIEDICRDLLSST